VKFKRVLVLMSTWNGERYLCEQINSILTQKFDGKIDLLIRDDGSNDSTRDLLKSFESARVRLIYGSNIGAKASFFELLELAKKHKADYYALADQDDVWLPDKISRAVNLLSSMTMPALYSSSLNVVDDRLNFLYKHYHVCQKSFTGLLFNNIVTGCTCVINRPLLDILRSPICSKRVLMHDWWLASTAAAYGVILYDEYSGIKYRQHSCNHIGISTGFLSVIRRIRKFYYGPPIPSRISQANEFLNTYLDRLPISLIELLRSFLNGSTSARVRMIFLWEHRRNINMLSIFRFMLRP
jgi:glycosyltransferase involved in cell wall biosynthesis